MTVKDFARVARGDIECAISFNGNAYPFFPDDPLSMSAYGDFLIDHVELFVRSRADNSPLVRAELELKTELVKRAAGGRETEAPNSRTSTPGTYAPVNTAHPAC